MAFGSQDAKYKKMGGKRYLYGKEKGDVETVSGSIAIIEFDTIRIKLERQEGKATEELLKKEREVIPIEYANLSPVNYDDSHVFAQRGVSPKKGVAKKIKIHYDNLPKLRAADEFFGDPSLREKGKEKKKKRGNRLKRAKAGTTYIEEILRQKKERVQEVFRDSRRRSSRRRDSRRRRRRSTSEESDS